MADDRERLELAIALKHDVGKAVAWRSANVDRDWDRSSSEPTPPSRELIEAWRADLLGPDGGAPIWRKFRELAARWPGPWPRELERVRDAIDRLEALAQNLEAVSWVASAERARLLREAQFDVRRGLSELVRAERA